VPAVVVGLAELLLPFMVLPLMTAIETIPRSVEEAARNLGATPLQLVRRVLLPLSLPGLVSGSLLVYSVSISALVTPALMGGRRVSMLGNLVYDEVLTSMNWPFASSIAVVLLAFTGAVMVGYLRTMRALARRAGADEGAVGRAVDRLVAEGVTAIAVCYLHSYRNPCHARRSLWTPNTRYGGNPAGVVWSGASCTMAGVTTRP